MQSTADEFILPSSKFNLSNPEDTHATKSIFNTLIIESKNGIKLSEAE